METIFRNPGMLEEEYLPRLLPYREDQHKYLADCVKPVLFGRPGKNVVISGATGIGKTACARFLIRELKEQTDNVFPVYINCWKRDTTYRVIHHIGEQIGIKPYMMERKRADEIFDMILRNMSSYGGAFFVFDEIDKVRDYDFLYRLLEDVKLKTIFMITNNEGFLAELDNRIRSRLLAETVRFRPYDLSETSGILRERVDHAFAQGVWNQDAFQLVCRKTCERGNMRFGLFLLREAGNIAESRGSDVVEASDVMKELEKIEGDGEKKVGEF